MQPSKKAVYNVKGKPKQRLIVIGVQNKHHAANLITYVLQRTGWTVTPDNIKVTVKRCTC